MIKPRIVYRVDRRHLFLLPPQHGKLVRLSHLHVANMTRADARDFLQLAAEIKLQPKVTAFQLQRANDALVALKNDSIDGAAVIIP